MYIYIYVHSRLVFGCQLWIFLLFFHIVSMYPRCVSVMQDYPAEFQLQNQFRSENPKLNNVHVYNH